MAEKIIEVGPLLQARLDWEAANPRPENLRRAERAIVRGLAAEFGKGKQSQYTSRDGFTIFIEGLEVVVTRLDEKDPISS
jgi:hypothetical protein